MVAMFAVTAGVVTLKLIDRALPGVPELSELLLVMMIYLAVGYTQIKGRHVRLDMLLERASPRTRNIMEVVASSLVIIIVAFLVWQTSIKAFHAIEIGEYIAGAVQFPVAPSRISISIGLFFLLIYLILNVIRRLRTPASDLSKLEVSTKQEGEV